MCELLNVKDSDFKQLQYLNNIWKQEHVIHFSWHFIHTNYIEQNEKVEFSQNNHEQKCLLRVGQRDKNLKVHYKFIRQSFFLMISCIILQEDTSEGDHESWDDDMMMPESNETPLSAVSIIFL